jgi:hypothetical protein
MPITALLWPDADPGVPNASDVHVVKGVPSPNLLERLLVIDDTDKTKSVEDYIDLGREDLTIEFRPLFAGVLVTDKDDKNAGRIVQRTFQRARWHDGKTFLWVGRRSQSGRGEGSSGLAFDHVLERGERDIV